jgi:hypothetical protein
MTGVGVNGVDRSLGSPITAFDVDPASLPSIACLQTRQMSSGLMSAGAGGIKGSRSVSCRQPPLIDSAAPAILKSIPDCFGGTDLVGAVMPGTVISNDWKGKV